MLDFIRSRRYRSTPLNFANALAGLPHIHWRQSMALCVRLGDDVYHGPTYIQFLIVAKTLKHRSACVEDSFERMKTRLLKAKGEDIGLLNMLAENWYFLRRAIETIFQGEQVPEEAFPYRVFAEYQRRTASKRELDAVLAEREIVTTPAYAKWRAQQVGAMR